MTRIIARAVILVISMSAAGCDRPDAPVYSHFEQIGAKGWDPLDVLIFDPLAKDSLLDTSRCYKMQLVARSSARGEASDMPIAVCLEDENGTQHNDTLTLSQKGARIVYGVRETSMTLYPSVRISAGTTLSVSPVVATGPEPALLNVGIILSDTVAPPRKPTELISDWFDNILR